MDIINQVKNLKLTKDQYVVVGSGIMAMHGLKEIHDIDIVVSPEIFEGCKNKGWKTMHYTYPDKPGEIYLKQGDIELYTDVNCRNFNPTLQELLSKAEYFSGIPFICLDDLIKFKTEYNRPKDHKDIELMENYLRAKRSSPVDLVQ
ncbi:MAG: hypothetical protein WCV82_04195 [Candidatus Paceibacterota bacterium]|jgi:hypothetical protein